jgi:proteasome accessory factor C
LAEARVAVRLAGNNARLAEFQGLVDHGRALRLTYYTASRDETADRVVDPMRVLMAGGKSYLEAWCRRAEAVRMFRLDRIDGCVELDEPAVLPPQARPSDVRDGIFHPTPDLPLVRLRVGRGARWITEYYPCEEVRRDADHWLVSLRVVDLGWARRLVLGLGPDVTVVAPAELAAVVGGEARAALDAYVAAAPRAPGPPVA